MMKKSTILLLKKLNKSDKNQAYYDIYNKNNELDQEVLILENRKKNLKDELFFKNSHNEEFILMNPSTNWHNALSEQISEQQLVVTNLLDSIDLSKLRMKEIIKNSLLYNNLS